MYYVANVDDKSIHGNGYSKIVEKLQPKKMKFCGAIG
jgi:hypothetical protein